MRPASVHGVKVPDGSYQNSCTVTQVLKYSITATNATTAFIIGVNKMDSNGHLIDTDMNSLIPGQCTKTIAVGVGADTSYIYDLGLCVTTTTEANLWETAGAVGYAMGHPGLSTILGGYRNIRLVSAGVHISSAPSSTTDQGWYTVTPLFRGIGNSNVFRALTPCTLASVQNMVGAITVPIKGNPNGVSSIWKPVDNACMEYVPVDVRYEHDQTLNREDIDIQRRDVGGWVIVVHGTTTIPILVEVVSNFEAQALNQYITPGSSVDRLTHWRCPMR